MSVHGQYTPLPKLQYGVGLLEVLVALLLLGIAALGYSALQGQALKSTDESLSRTQAISLLTDTAESIRVNALGVTYILKVSPDTADTAPSSATVMDVYQTQLSADDIPDAECVTDDVCTPSQTAINDVRKAKLKAQALDMQIGASTCPGTADKGNTMCLIAAWNDTSAKMADDDSNSCMKSNGAYRLGADCVYMEAY